MKKLTITENQKQFFAEKGYLVVDHVLTDEDLQPVIDEITSEIDARAKTLLKAGDISALFDDEGFETRLAKISQQSPKLAPT